MDSMRIGRAYRALRIRRGWRQQDLAEIVGVSRQLIAKVESGRVDDVQVGTLRRIAEALGASIDIGVRWQGEGLDRLLDAAHAGLVETVVDRLQRAGWLTIVEASFSIRGERGSVDLLAFHQPTTTLLVVEVKSVVPDSQAMMYAIDRKVRLAPEIARDRGWTCTTVGRLLVVGASSTARRRVELLDTTYRSAFPVRGRSVLTWLRRPAGAVSGLLFVPFATRGGSTNRVRVDSGFEDLPGDLSPPGMAYGAVSRPPPPECHPGWHMGVAAWRPSPGDPGRPAAQPPNRCSTRV